MQPVLVVAWLPVGSELAPIALLVSYVPGQERRQKGLSVR
jgi:hypothetical protein